MIKKVVSRSFSSFSEETRTFSLKYFFESASALESRQDDPKSHLILLLWLNDPWFLLLMGFEWCGWVGIGSADCWGWVGGGWSANCWWMLRDWPVVCEWLMKLRVDIGWIPWSIFHIFSAISEWAVISPEMQEEHTKWVEQFEKEGLVFSGTINSKETSGKYFLFQTDSELGPYKFLKQVLPFHKVNWIGSWSSKTSFEYDQDPFYRFKFVKEFSIDEIEMISRSKFKELAKIYKSSYV